MIMVILWEVKRTGLHSRWAFSNILSEKTDCDWLFFQPTGYFMIWTCEREFRSIGPNTPEIYLRRVSWTINNSPVSCHICRQPPGDHFLSFYSHKSPYLISFTCNQYCQRKINFVLLRCLRANFAWCILPFLPETSFFTNSPPFHFGRTQLSVGRMKTRTKTEFPFEIWTSSLDFRGWKMFFHCFARPLYNFPTCFHISSC